MEDIDLPVEDLMMAAVGDALKGVIDQFTVRLASMQADFDQKLAALEDRCNQLESMVEAQAPREVLAEVVKAIKALPTPEFTINPEVNVKSHVEGLAEALKSMPAPEYTIENTFSPTYKPPAVVVPQVKVPDINVPALKLPDKFILEMPPRETEKTIEYDFRDRPVNIREKQTTVKED